LEQREGGRFGFVRQDRVWKCAGHGL
jgi:hypothetical protein